MPTLQAAPGICVILCVQHFADDCRVGSIVEWQRICSLGHVLRVLTWHPKGLSIQILGSRFVLQRWMLIQAWKRPVILEGLRCHPVAMHRSVR